MNAQISEVRNIALAALTFSTTPSQKERRAHFDKNELKELAGSIKDAGVIQAILVRPFRDEHVSGECFEVVAGERRVIAARQAGLTEIPATVRELTDAQVTELQLIENLQRAGLHELAEAEGYEQLLKNGHTAETIAEKVGKSKATVYARIKLLALCPEARKAFYDGKLSASTALLLARIPIEKHQKQALKEVTTPGWDDGPLSYRQAADHIQRTYMLKLSEAPFDTKAEDLVRGAVACGRCPKNTLAQPELFGDVKSGSAGVCTDPGCYAAKREAWGKQALERAARDGREVITGADAKKVAPHGAERSLAGFRRLDERCYEDPKSRTVRQIVGKDAPVALLQDPSSGDVVEVVRESALRSKLKEQGVSSGRNGNAPQAAADKKAKAERAYRRALFDQVRPLLPTELDLPLLRAIAAAYAGRLWHELRKQICGIYGWEPKKKQYGTDVDTPIETAVAKMEWDELVQFLQVCDIATELQVSTYSKDKPERLLAAAKRVGVDAEKVRRDCAASAAEKQKPKKTAPAKKRKVKQ